MGIYDERKLGSWGKVFWRKEINGDRELEWKVMAGRGEIMVVEG